MQGGVRCIVADVLSGILDCGDSVRMRVLQRGGEVGEREEKPVFRPASSLLFDGFSLGRLHLRSLVREERA